MESLWVGGWHQLFIYSSLGLDQYINNDMVVSNEYGQAGQGLTYLDVRPDMIKDKMFLNAENWI